MDIDVVLVAKCSQCIYTNCKQKGKKFVTSLSAEQLSEVFPEKEFKVKFEDCKQYTPTAEYYKQNVKPVEYIKTFTVNV